MIDTEGIGAYNEEDNHDIKIFLVAMLISSFFVYNSVGNIDEMAIQNLSLIINLGKHLQKTNETEFDDLISSFPNFLWVVRDFALKLVDPTGNPISSKEYLENALRIQKGSSEMIESKNRIRFLFLYRINFISLTKSEFLFYDLIAIFKIKKIHQYIQIKI